MKRSMAVMIMSAMLLTSYTTVQGEVSAAAASAQSALTGHIENSVNLRSKPSLSGGVVGLVKKGTTVAVLEKTNDYWYKIQTSDGKTGYVSASEKYISVSGGVSQNQGGQGTSAVVIYGVNLRTQPSVSSGKVVKMLGKGTKLTILEQSNSYFYKVRTEDGQTGYVSTSSKYLQIGGTVSSPAPSNPAPEQSASISEQVQKVIQAGLKYLGTPYEFGSNRNTTTTFDCSDFVRQAYKDALGIVLPADSRKQGTWIRNNGTAVYDIGSLKAGDLVFFSSYKGSSASAYAGMNPNTERITHVAIYMGDGKILQTYSVKSGGVRVDDFDGAWKYRFLYGGSVLK
ncbi:SH3 domain-containing C40 family peptidase [Paenibacillus sp. M1]|uniref:SH3 domain-containing C40 family peptidase n=1 Tax=Paenibacillus haidiansis TaxID=1574488 RepID=A0ABU7VUU1_9BACL